MGPHKPLCFVTEVVALVGRRAIPIPLCTPGRLLRLGAPPRLEIAPTFQMFRLSRVHNNSSNNTMGRGKSKQQKAARKEAKKRSTLVDTNDSMSWTDKIRFLPNPDEKERVVKDHAEGLGNATDDSSVHYDLSIVSWNVLAEAYCSRRSHVLLPESYNKAVFRPASRRKKLCACIRKLAESASVICLQELDRTEIISTLEDELGYTGVSTPTEKTGGRVDACSIHVNPSVWEIIEHKVIWFDDLAAAASKDGDKKVERELLFQHLQGVRQSFRRRNVGVITRLRRNTTTVVVANAHLFWNPSFEYIKLCQAHYLLLCVRNFRLSVDEPVVLCGDFNSKPKGRTHEYLTKGHTNARTVSPWYTASIVTKTELSDAELDDECSNDSSGPDADIAEISETVTAVKIDDRHDDSSTADSDNDEKEDNTSDAEPDNETSKSSSETGVNCVATSGLAEHVAGPKYDPNPFPVDFDPQMPVRYLVDASLNKFCRWLRILGQDVGLETEEEEIQRTKHNDFQIIDRCKREHRALVTTSPKLMQRRNCPPSAYCITPTYLPTPKLEVALVHMLKTHGVTLEPANFLTRCVVCNGTIVPADDDVHKRSILEEYDAPTDVLLDGPVYCCSTCNQGYWWNDRPGSSASRVKMHCTRLFELCLRGQVPFKGPLGMFDFVDARVVQAEGWDQSIPGSAILREPFPAIDWLGSEHLTCPIRVKSAFSDGNGGEILPFTNVTARFVDTLDYIWYSNDCSVSQLLYIPHTFAELADSRKVPNAHLLPSDVWPSDHLAIGAILRIPSISPLLPSTETKLTAPNVVPSMTSTKAPSILPGIGLNSRIGIVSTPGATPGIPAGAPLTCLRPADRAAQNGMSSFPLAAGPLALPPGVVHGVNCQCCLIPTVPSMFEMAKLRKQHREKMKREQERKQQEA